MNAVSLEEESKDPRLEETTRWVHWVDPVKIADTLVDIHVQGAFHQPTFRMVEKAQAYYFPLLEAIVEVDDSGKIVDVSPSGTLKRKKRTSLKPDDKTTRFKKLSGVIKLLRAIPKMCLICQSTKDKLLNEDRRTGHSPFAVPGEVFQIDMVKLDDKLKPNNKLTRLVTVIDQALKYPWAFFVQNKHPATIIECLELIAISGENFVPKTLRSDNGGEFKNTPLHSWCEERNITIWNGRPWTPED